MVTNTPIKTERLVLRPLTLDDAEFMCKLLNDPGWIKNIGDKDIRTVPETKEYLLSSPIHSYLVNGFGLLLVELLNGTPIGICGWVKRQELDSPDLGFAFVEEYTGKGYGYESSMAVIAHGRQSYDFNKVYAIINPDNTHSIKLVVKLGFKADGKIKLASNNQEIDKFAFYLHPSQP